MAEKATGTSNRGTQKENKKKEVIKGVVSVVCLFVLYSKRADTHSSLHEFVYSTSISKSCQYETESGNHMMFGAFLVAQVLGDFGCDSEETQLLTTREACHVIANSEELPAIPAELSQQAGFQSSAQPHKQKKRFEWKPS